MTEKKGRKKKKENEKPTPALPDERKRFGAVAFFDSRTEADANDGEAVLSLDALRDAFAAFDHEQQETPAVAEEPESVEEASEDSDEPVCCEDVAIDLSPQTILEAMLFVGNRENRPLAPQQAAERMRNVTPEEIDEAVSELNRTYERFGCPYHIAAEPDGYRMLIRTEFEAVRKKFYRKVREEMTLSQQAIDTLAIVAYRQPISAEEAQVLRKEPCTATLALLVRYGLVSRERQSSGKKKVVVYRTTERFLELFNLASLADLPLSEEIG